jgi:hypothetical protein
MSAIIYDARGNEIRVGYPDTVTNETVTDPRPITAVLSALNAEIIMDLNGACTAYFDVRNTAANMTLSFEGTIDNVNYIALPAFTISGNVAGTLTSEVYILNVSIATTIVSVYAVGVTGFRRIRIRVSTFASGSVTVAARASSADLIIYKKPIPTTLHVSVTAAVNTGATATLGAVAGLFHYITRVELIKLYSVVGIAAGAGVIITTTNLPGGPSFTTEQIASVAGTATKVIDLNYAGNPLRSLVAGAATTFVAGAQLQTIWRWNVSYYVGL